MELLLGNKAIKGKKHMTPLRKKLDIGMNEIDHKIGIAVKKGCQVTISPLLQHMLGFKGAMFPQGDHVADQVIDVTRGVHSLHHHASSLEWYFDSGIIPYIYCNGLTTS
jgi:hypothetical protein